MLPGAKKRSQEQKKCSPEHYFLHNNKYGQSLTCQSPPSKPTANTAGATNSSLTPPPTPPTPSPPTAARQRQTPRCHHLTNCHRHCKCQCHCTNVAASPTTASNATTMGKLAVIHCQRKRQQQQHHQHTNGSTNVKTFTSPDNLDLFNLSIVFKVCDVGRGTLAISKL